MIFDVDAVFFGQPLHQVTGHPHLIGGFLGALAEDLEFPLALRDFGIDAFVVDAGGEAEVEMLLDDLAGDVTDVGIADAGVIRTLRCGIATGREACMVELPSNPHNGNCSSVGNESNSLICVLPRRFGVGV
jgi:hypothetical protein